MALNPPIKNIRRFRYSLSQMAYLRVPYDLFNDNPGEGKATLIIPRTKPSHKTFLKMILA